MKTIKSIDGKSLLIGALLASTIFLGVAATNDSSKKENINWWIAWHSTDKVLPDGKSGEHHAMGEGDWEPFAVSNDGKKMYFRSRVSSKAK